MKLEEAAFQLNLSIDEIEKAVRILNRAGIKAKEAGRRLGIEFNQGICNHEKTKEFFKDVEWWKICDDCGKLSEPTKLEMLAIITLEKNGKVVDDTITPRH